MKIKKYVIPIGLLTLLIVAISYCTFVTENLSFEPVYSLYHDSITSSYLNSLNTDNGSRIFLFSKRFFVFNHFYSLLLKIIPLPLALKLTSMVLWFFSILLIHKTGTHLISKNFGLLFAWIFFSIFLTMDTFYGGGFRTFGVFIYILFIFLFVKEKFTLMPFLLIAAIVFYPYIFISLSITCFLVLFFYIQNSSLQSKYIKVLIFSIASSIVFLSATSSNLFHVSLSQLSLLLDHKYIQNVAMRINPYNPLQALSYFFLNLNEHGNLYKMTMKFSLAILGLFMIFRRKKSLMVPKQIWIIMTGSVLGFTFLYPLIPVIASRQVVFTVPLFISFLLAINIDSLAKKNGAFLVIIYSCLIFFILISPQFNDIEDCKKYKPAYDYVNTLNKNCVFAGYPKSLLLETIPFYSKNKAFYLDQTKRLYFSTFSQSELNERRGDLIKALYSKSFNEVIDFVSRYNIDFFIIESYHYNKSFVLPLQFSLTEEDKEDYHFISTQLDRSSFILLEYAKKNADYSFRIDEGWIYILDVKKLLKNKDA